MPDASVSAIFTASIDDDGQIFVNERPAVPVPYPWSMPTQFSAPLHISETEPNVIAMTATNRVYTLGIDRGALLVVQRAIMSQPQLLVTDPRWRVTLAAPGPKWTAADYDDASWGAAVIQAPYGQPPYNTPLAFTPTNAAYVWAYNNADGGPHPVPETLWLRRTFWLLRDGGLSFDGGRCP